MGARSASARVTFISNKPEVSVYLNSAFRGRTDDNGRLIIERLPAGRYQLRARKVGCKDYRFEFQVAAGQARQLRVNLLSTNDPADLAYQRGEQLREEKKFEASTEEYKAALELRRQFPQARLGLARSLLALNEHEEAQQQAELAIRERRGQDPEGYTVLGNILRGAGQYEEAADAYRRALRLARDFSPEAHTGLALTMDDMDEPEKAIQHLRKAIAQDGDGEPILYNLLGNMLLAVERKREALKAFEMYLRLAPNSNDAPAIKSLIEQVREELATQP
jgi:tetratricopeptide (TPR) repeat protein